MEQSIYGAFSFTGDCEGYNGQEMKCEIVFKNGENAPPVANDVAFETVEGMVCQGELNITEPNGDIYTINVETYPEKGLITVSDKGKIIYTPHSGFSGKDRMVYSVTDCFGKKSQSAVVDFQVLKKKVISHAKANHYIGFIHPWSTNHLRVLVPEEQMCSLVLKPKLLFG